MIARKIFGAGIVVVVAALVVHVLTWGSPAADKATMAVFLAGGVLAGIGVLGGATERGPKP